MPYRTVARGLTFTWFAISLVFFWGKWPVILELADGLGAIGMILSVCLLIPAAGILLSLGQAARLTVMRIEAFGIPVLLSRYTRTIWVTAMGATAVAALSLLASPAPDVVYKTF